MDVPHASVGDEKAAGSIDGVEVFEQNIMVMDESGKEGKFRLISVALKKATRDGDVNDR